MTKSIRLNANIRKGIIDRISAAYVLKNPEPYYPSEEDMQKAFKDAVYKDWKKASDAIASKLESVGLLNTILPTASFIFVVKGTQMLFQVLAPEVTPYELLKLFRPNASSTVYCDVTNLKAGPIKQAYAKYLKDMDKRKYLRKSHVLWQRSKDAFMEDVTDAVNGVNSTGQLLDVWPECEEYIPKGITNPSLLSRLTVDVRSLNSKL